MAKRKPRKKTKLRGGLELPAKGTMRDMADELWRFAVFDDWDNKCAVCGKRKGDIILHPHHVVPRQFEATHFLLRNGIALCSWHHLRDENTSPHVNAVGWTNWLKAHHRALHDWYQEVIASGDHKKFDGTKSWPYYVDRILELKPFVEEEEFSRICGLKFGQWLEAEEEEVGNTT